MREELRRTIRYARKSAIALVGCFVGLFAFLTPLPAAAYGSTLTVSIAPSMTLSRSYVEVEAPVTVTCDPIGAYDSYVYIRLTQAHTGATASGSVRPLICDSTAHTYVVHLFADNTPFQDGPTAATATAENVAQNFVQQSGSAQTTTSLNLGTVDVQANGVRSLTTGSTYSVAISGRATLFGKNSGTAKGYAQAMVPITVTCTPPTSAYAPWIGAGLESADGSRLVIGNDGQFTSNGQQPALVCDGQAHTYTWTLSGVTSTAPYDYITPGDVSVAVWVENDYTSPQCSTGARNPDAVETVHATNG